MLSSDWGKIPGNEFVHSELRKLLATGRAISFTGAGASAELYGTWQRLISELASHALSAGLATEADKKFWLENAATRPQHTVRGIRGRLSDGVYRRKIESIFSPKTGESGLRFTEAHRLLVQANFRGHITTNYDPGLLEARAAIYPNKPAAAFSTWKDQSALASWLSQEVFSDDVRPILFLHGYYDRADTIVLDADDYREAYGGALKKFVGSIWNCLHLVFVGFGFSDRWFDYIISEGVLAPAAGGARHVALLPLYEDQSYTPEHRKMWLEQYGANILFYPVHRDTEGKWDHGALVKILEGLSR